MVQPLHLHTGTRVRMLLARRPQTWYSRAVEVYRQSSPERSIQLRDELAARVAALTERSIALETIYIDEAEHTATVAVDGVVFQLRRNELILLRACPECGLGAYESPSIRTTADLGYALSAWQPSCRNCAYEDPANWLEYQTL